MPQVPYNPVPSEKPSQQGLPSVQINTPAAAFGSEVAQATSAMGMDIARAGDEIFNKAIALQQVRNQAEATEADTEYMVQSGQLHAEYNALKGKTAVDAFPKYQQDLRKLRDDIRGTLTSDDARKRYDPQSLSTMGRHIFNGAGHAATENKKWVVGTAEAKLTAESDYILQNPDDGVAFKQGLISIERNVRGTMAPAFGWSPEQTEVAVKKAQSNLVTQRILGTAIDNPNKASVLLEGNRQHLTTQDFDRAHKYVQSQQINRGAREIAIEVSQPDERTGEPPPIKDQLAKAERIAKQYSNDPLFLEAVQQRVEGKFRFEKKIKDDVAFENKQTIYKAINITGQKMPTNEDELKALGPEVAAAYEALTTPEQKQMRALLRNNTKDDYPDTEEAFQQFRAVKGLATGDASAKTALLETNVMELPIPRKYRDQLLNLQTAVKKNTEADPRVMRAMGYLTQPLRAAGITNQDDLAKFRGGLQDALDVFQQEHKRGPDAKEIQIIGARLMQEQADPTKWTWGVFNRTTPLWQQTVPENISNQIKADPMWSQLNIVPDEDMIRRVYVRKLYEQTLKTKKDKPK